MFLLELFCKGIERRPVKVEDVDRLGACSRSSVSRVGELTDICTIRACGAAHLLAQVNGPLRGCSGCTGSAEAFNHSAGRGDWPDAFEAAYACDDGDLVGEAAGRLSRVKVVLDGLETGEGALLLLLDGGTVRSGHFIFTMSR